MLSISLFKRSSKKVAKKENWNNYNFDILFNKIP